MSSETTLVTAPAEPQTTSEATSTAEIEKSRSDSPFSSSSSKLATLISACLPPSSPELNIHHISHPPTRCAAIYSAPEGSKEERTTLVSHFLAVSDRSTGFLVYAIEVNLYQTSTRTTLFVSKADSTGFFPSSKSTTKGKVSPVRAITSTFIQHLLDSTKREGVTSHLTLFARAQDQYLFPNSIHNSGKHVLSDIQLIRWWARVFDPLLKDENFSADSVAKAYLLVPGLDRSDLRNVFPPNSPEWVHGHPYSHPTKPVRECIPHFEDDPKARFMDELEEGGWKSARNMAQFWELMAFRQECSLGKSVGFLSLVYEPNKPLSAVSRSGLKKATSKAGTDISSGSQGSQTSQVDSQESVRTASNPSTPRKQRPKLPISVSDISSASTYTIASLLRHPSTLSIWSQRSLSNASSQSGGLAGASMLPQSPAGGKVVAKKEYDKLMASLLDSDFGGKRCVKESSEIWIRLVGSEELPSVTEQSSEKAKESNEDPAKPAVHILTVKKRAHDGQEEDGVNVLQPRKKETSTNNTVVNTLQPRKKTKNDEDSQVKTPVVNVLQPRKKAKDDEPVSVEVKVNILQPRKKVTEADSPKESATPSVNILQPRKKAKPENETVDNVESKAA